jgi:hypothetical protein
MNSYKPQVNDPVYAGGGRAGRCPDYVGAAEEDTGRRR